MARGTTRELTTDAAGEYTAPELLSGTYTVRAEAKGFQTVEHTNVLLEVAQQVRVDLTLMPGEQTQTVTVTEEIPAIDTTSSTLGDTVTSQSMVALPLLNRNFLNLVQLSPGVVDMPGGGAAGTAWSTNGRKEGADVVVIEGVNQFDLATPNVLINGQNKGGGDTELPLDSVQEFSTLAEPSGGIWLERRIGHKPWDQVGNQRHSWHCLCLRTRCGGDRCESILIQPARDRIGQQLASGAAGLHGGWPHTQEQALLVHRRRIYPSVQLQHGRPKRANRCGAAGRRCWMHWSAQS